MSVHRRLLQRGVQDAQAIEIGAARAAVVQQPIDLGVYCFLGHNIEQRDWRSTNGVHLRDRESEYLRDRAFECAGANDADLYATAQTRV